MLVDTHAHLNFNAYKDDSEMILKKALDVGMGIIMPGSQFSTSKRAVEFAEKWDNPRVWAAVGLHPVHLEKRKVDRLEATDSLVYETGAEKFNRAEYEKLARSGKTVAIGEIGLDYWFRPKTKEKGAAYAQKQIDALNSQLDLALDIKKPVILHCRVAHKDLLKVLAAHPHTESREIPGVVHSYTGSVKQLKKFINLGYYIGINGLVFKLDLVREAVKAAPLDRMVLETDSPYLTPPDVTEERNEPYNLKYIAQYIAELKGINASEVEKHTAENAQKIFKVNFS